MKLVYNWRNSWRWYSQLAATGAVAIQGAWVMLPPDLAAQAPQWAVHAATVGILVLGILGRLVDQGDET